jgi:hypothetical protein
VIGILLVDAAIVQVMQKPFQPLYKGAIVSQSTTEAKQKNNQTRNIRMEG